MASLGSQPDLFICYMTKRRARIVAIANQKGGVAKTTTAINLAASLALANQEVLLVDLDPQSNLTSGLGLKGHAGPFGTAYVALTADAVDPSGVVLRTGIDHLSIVPSDRNLTGAEIELVQLDQREYRLRRLLDPLGADFDFIFVDTPPSLGLLTLNALVAADSVLVPVNCEYFALEGIAELMSTIDRVRAALNPTLALEGVLLTMYDDRTNLGQQVSANIREYFGDQVYRTVIPRNIRLGEAPSHGVPVILYDARSRGAEAYVALAQEFIARRRALNHAVHGGHGEEPTDDHDAHGVQGASPESALADGDRDVSPAPAIAGGRQDLAADGPAGVVNAAAGKEDG
jgi:chromosome partitioning protein